MQSRVFGYPESTANKAILKYFDDQVDSIASIAAAHFGIPLPPRSATNDYSDFWAQVDLGLRRTKIIFPPDSQWMKQSPAWTEHDIDGSDVRLHILFRMAVVGATVHITTQPAMMLANSLDVRNARIALMRYHMRPTDSFDPQHASGQTQHLASPEPTVSGHSSDEEEKPAADSARKPAPTERPKPAVKRKADIAQETDELSGQEEDTDPAPTEASQKSKKACHQAKASEFLAIFDQNTIAGVNGTNNLTKRFKLMFIATVVNSELYVSDVKAALGGVTIDQIRLEIVVGLWLNSVLQRRKTTTAELHIQFDQAMRSESNDLTDAFESMVHDLVSFCKDDDKSPFAPPAAMPQADGAESTNLDGSDSKPPQPDVSNTSHTLGRYRVAIGPSQ
jgi:hypothetical protein